MNGEMGDDPVAGNSLLCGESRDFIGFLENEELSCPKRSSAEEDAFFVLGEEWEHLEELIGNEPGWGFEGRSSSGSAKDSFRSNAVDWIINTSLHFGFHSHTTYLSITYFDRFLVARSVENEKSWAVKLLSLASLSLAAKMEECKVPALPDFCVQYYVFDSKCMKKMELLILTTLEWRMASVTPYTYLRYFIRKFFGESCDKEKELLFATMDLVLTISKEINTLDFRPSVVAAAAVLASTGDELTRNKVESKTSSISTGVSLDNETKAFVMEPNMALVNTGSRHSFLVENKENIWTYVLVIHNGLYKEHVYECYRLIQDIKGRRNSKTPRKNTSFSSFSEDPSCCNPGNGSRKRLLFIESHQAPSNTMHKGNNTHASTDTK